MVFEPDTYSESSTILENIIVEAHREFILQNRDKTAGQSGASGTLARTGCSISHARVLRCSKPTNLLQSGTKFDIKKTADISSFLCMLRFV